MKLHVSLFWASTSSVMRRSEGTTQLCSSVYQHVISMFTVYVYLPATHHERYCQLSFQCHYQIYTVAVTLPNYLSHRPIITPRLNEKFRHAKNSIWSIKYSRLRHQATLASTHVRARTHRNDRYAKFKPLLGSMSFKEVSSTSWVTLLQMGWGNDDVRKSAKGGHNSDMITQFHLVKSWELVQSYLHDPVFVINLMTGEGFVSPKVYDAVTRASSCLQRMSEQRGKAIRAGKTDQSLCNFKINFI